MSFVRKGLRCRSSKSTPCAFSWMYCGGDRSRRSSGDNSNKTVLKCLDRPIRNNQTLGNKKPDFDGGHLRESVNQGKVENRQGLHIVFGYMFAVTEAAV